MAEIPYDGIRINFPDGSVWFVDANKIAEDRAKYYTQKDFEDGEFPQEEYNDQFAEEVRWVLKDDFELIDWMLNNMDWEEIQPHLEMLEPPPTSKYKEWLNNSEMCRMAHK